MNQFVYLTQQNKIKHKDGSNHDSIGLFPDFFQDFAQKVKVLRKCHKQFANLQAVALLQ